MKILNYIIICISIVLLGFNFLIGGNLLVSFSLFLVIIVLTNLNLKK